MRYNLENWLKEHFIREADGRYYTVSLEQDIMGQWVIRKTWGGNTKTAGVVKILPVEDIKTAEPLLKSIRNRRLSHGYSLTT